MTDPRARLDAALETMPLLAVLRGIAPGEALAVGEALVEAGVPVLEVPLNSPEPFESIRLIAERFGDRALVGAGTVLDPADVPRVAEAGGRIVVAPNFHPGVVRASVEAGLVAMPGVFTPTEAFAALEAGAHGLKLFPGDLISPKVVGALRAVLPRQARVVVTGGVGVANLADYLAAGADGAGIGSALYKPGRPAAEVGEVARALTAAARHARAA